MLSCSTICTSINNTDIQGHQSTKSFFANVDDVTLGFVLCYDDTMSYYITRSSLSTLLSTQLHFLSSSSLHKLPNEKSLTTKEHIFLIIFTSHKFHYNHQIIIIHSPITWIFGVDHDVICKNEKSYLFTLAQESLAIFPLDSFLSRLSAKFALIKVIKTRLLREHSCL